MIKAGYLESVVYGFQRSGSWIEPTLRYTARDLMGGTANDDDPGRIRPGADISGAAFTSYLCYSRAWFDLTYAHKKVASVRNLHRTSLPIPHAGGVYPAKPLQPILGGLLTFESDWSPGLGDPLREALKDRSEPERLDLGCVAAHGIFECAKGGEVTLTTIAKPATAFLFELIARLQEMATVPMIDVRAYAAWLGADLD